MPQWVNDACDIYIKRLPKSFKLNFISIPAQKRTKSKDISTLLQLEGDQILSKVPPSNIIIALDRLGQTLSTEQIASKFQNWHDLNQDICLLVGGPEGLSKSCLDAASTTWSLSALTLPHPLVRVVLAEQCYRAWSIMTRHPYHR